MEPEQAYCNTGFRARITCCHLLWLYTETTTTLNSYIRWTDQLWNEKKKKKRAISTCGSDCDIKELQTILLLIKLATFLLIWNSVIKDGDCGQLQEFWTESDCVTDTVEMWKIKSHSTVARWNDAIQYKQFTFTSKISFTSTIHYHCVQQNLQHRCFHLKNWFLPPIRWAETRELDNFLQTYNILKIIPHLFNKIHKAE